MTCPRCGVVTAHAECFIPDSTVPVTSVTVNGEEWHRAAPRAEGLDPHRLGGLIERAIRDSKRASGGLLPDGWTLVEMALAYPPETPTEPSQSIREETPE